MRDIRSQVVLKLEADSKKLSVYCPFFGIYRIFIRKHGPLSKFSPLPVGNLVSLPFSLLARMIQQANFQTPAVTTPIGWCHYAAFSMFDLP
jgi:hypothetical protein